MVSVAFLNLICSSKARTLTVFCKKHFSKCFTNTLSWSVCVYCGIQPTKPVHVKTRARKLSLKYLVWPSANTFKRNNLWLKMRRENTNHFCYQSEHEFTFRFLPTFYLVWNSSPCFSVLNNFCCCIPGLQVCAGWEQQSLLGMAWEYMTWRKRSHLWNSEDSRMKDEVLNLRL